MTSRSSDTVSVNCIFVCMYNQNHVIYVLFALSELVKIKARLYIGPRVCRDELGFRFLRSELNEENHGNILEFSGRFYLILKLATFIFFFSFTLIEKMKIVKAFVLT